MTKDNYERDIFISPCENCSKKGTEDCKTCKYNRWKKGLSPYRSSEYK